MMASPLQQVLIMEATQKWTPLNLGAAVKWWFDASLITGSNGDPQSTIVDKSASAYNLTQTGTNRATLVTAAQNSLNVLQFAQANSQYYPFTPATPLGTPSAASMYFVWKDANAAGTDLNIVFSLGSSANESHYPYTDGNFYNDFGSTVRYAPGIPTNAANIWRVCSHYSALNDWAIYVDGGTGGSGGGTSPLGHSASNTVGFTSTTKFGGGKAGYYANCQFGEVVITNAQQSTSDRQKMEGYLAWKWGIQGNLSASHPYKTAAP